jgi:methionyl aminopeptidase
MRPKNEKELARIRKSGQILASILNTIEHTVVAGMSGKDIDALCMKELQRLGGKPAFIGVSGGPGVQDFPSSICISIDDAVVHGIPNDKPFRNGDIVGFDFGVDYEGMITDAARTVIIGGEARSKREAQLVQQTLRSLDAGINAVKTGARTGDIGSAVQAVLEANGLGIVRELVGHGVGHDLHEPPEIPNYGFAGSGSVLKEGMTIAIEPMATLGEWRVVIDPDGWTIRTRDGSLSAHFEDTILVTAHGAEILTRL